MAISGTITFVSGGTLSITDENLVANSLSITMSTCRAKKFDFGTFNAALLKMGVVDDDALQHEFAGASVVLSVTFVDDDPESSTYEEEITEDLGKYWVDGTTIKRNKNTVSFTAQDATASFNTELPSNVRSTSYTPATLYAAACTACGVTLDSNVNPALYPNAVVTFTLESEAIQTWRDAVMWTCQMQAVNAIINRDGELTIRPAKQASSTENWDIGAGQRADIKFSDTRTYIKYMDAYSGKKVKTYISSAVISDIQARKGKIALAYNPLLANKTETDCDTINAAILAYIDTFLQRQIEAKLFDNPQVALDDLIRFRGGKIDIRRSVLGVATMIVWRYHGFTTVTCTAPDAITDE